MNRKNDSRKKCQPCEGLVAPMDLKKARRLLVSLEGWQLEESKNAIYRDLVLRNFRAAIDFVNRVAVVAEQEGHHPDMHLTDYKHIRIELRTHSIGGLSDNDFIVAAKINDLL